MVIESCCDCFMIKAINQLCLRGTIVVGELSMFPLNLKTMISEIEIIEKMLFYFNLQNYMKINLFLYGRRSPILGTTITPKILRNYYLLYLQDLLTKSRKKNLKIGKLRIGELGNPIGFFSFSHCLSICL